MSHRLGDPNNVPTHQSNRQGCTLNWRWCKETLVVESHHNLGMERKDVPLGKQFCSCEIRSMKRSTTRCTEYTQSKVKLEAAGLMSSSFLSSSWVSTDLSNSPVEFAFVSAITCKFLPLKNHFAIKRSNDSH